MDLGDFDVSRETSAAFDRLAALTRRWSRTINLVSPSTLHELERRHIADSCFLVACGPENGGWADLGSGGGFPGLIVAILSDRARRVTLVESDARKCAFLRNVRRELGLDVDIRNDRIEHLSPLGADIISARALAPLNKLLDLSVPHATPETTFLFPKGVTWRDEVEEAAKSWSFDLDAIDNPVQAGSVVLKIKNVKRT